MPGRYTHDDEETIVAHPSPLPRSLPFVESRDEPFAVFRTPPLDFTANEPGSPSFGPSRPLDSPRKPPSRISKKKSLGDRLGRFIGRGDCYFTVPNESDPTGPPGLVPIFPESPESEAFRRQNSPRLAEFESASGRLSESATKKLVTAPMHFVRWAGRKSSRFEVGGRIDSVEDEAPPSPPPPKVKVPPRKSSLARLIPSFGKRAGPSTMPSSPASSDSSFAAVATAGVDSSISAMEYLSSSGIRRYQEEHFVSLEDLQALDRSLENGREARQARARTQSAPAPPPPREPDLSPLYLFPEPPAAPTRPLRSPSSTSSCASSPSTVATAPIHSPRKKVSFATPPASTPSSSSPSPLPSPSRSPLHTPPRSPLHTPPRSPLHTPSPSPLPAPSPLAAAVYADEDEDDTDGDVRPVVNLDDLTGLVPYVPLGGLFGGNRNRSASTSTSTSSRTSRPRGRSPRRSNDNIPPVPPIPIQYRDNLPEEYRSLPLEYLETGIWPLHVRIPTPPSSGAFEVDEAEAFVNRSDSSSTTSD